ncbi:MAG: hypothetical protein IJ594_10095 [Oscillospiraceae bacterium]|nr:hypothetical protein [Oscillospiraceae bacterium]
MDEKKKKKETEAVSDEKGREKKRRAAAAAVAVVTSASLVVGGIFNSPAALLDDDPGLPQAAYTDDDDLDGTGGGDGGDEDGGAGGSEVEEEEEQGGVRAGVRQRVLQLPYAVRLLVILPLWCLGWLLLTGASALWAAVLSPVLGKALAWLLLLAALVGAFLLAGKTIFPDLPVKKILNRRSLLGLVIGSVALGAADIVVPLFWAEYTRVENIVRAVGVLLVFGTVTGLFARRELRRRRELAAAEAEEAAEPEPEEPRPLSREEILALADSVSRPR